MQLCMYGMSLPESVAASMQVHRQAMAAGTSYVIISNERNHNMTNYDPNENGAHGIYKDRDGDFWRHNFDEDRTEYYDKGEQEWEENTFDGHEIMRYAPFAPATQEDIDKHNLIDTPEERKIRDLEREVKRLNELANRKATLVAEGQRALVNLMYYSVGTAFEARVRDVVRDNSRRIAEAS